MDVDTCDPFERPKIMIIHSFCIFGFYDYHVGSRDVFFVWTGSSYIELKPESIFEGAGSQGSMRRKPVYFPG